MLLLWTKLEHWTCRNCEKDTQEFLYIVSLQRKKKIICGCSYANFLFYQFGYGRHSLFANVANVFHQEFERNIHSQLTCAAYGSKYRLGVLFTNQRGISDRCFEVAVEANCFENPSSELFKSKYIKQMLVIFKLQLTCRALFLSSSIRARWSWSSSPTGIPFVCTSPTVGSTH